MIKIKNDELSLRKISITTGIVLIVMAIAALFSFGLVFENLVDVGDVSATLNNIKSSHAFFSAGILGWLIILICDIVVAWGFFKILKPIHNGLSLLGAWFRLIYSSILGVAIMNLIMVFLLTSKGDYSSFIETSQLQMWVMLFLNAFEMTWSVGLIIFGGHLLIVGYLLFKSNNVPKVISILLLLASVGYIIIHLCFTFLPQLNGFTTILETIFSIPMILGELGFAIWLLFKGGKVPKSK